MADAPPLEPVTGNGSEPRHGLPWLPFIIFVVGALLTALLTWAVVGANAGNDHRLLTLQIRQAASALGSALPSIETPLTAAFDVATATHDPQEFKTFMAADVGPAKEFVSASLWQLSAGPPVPLVTVGAPPLLVAEGNAAAFFGQVQAGGAVSVTSLLRGSPPRLGYAEIPPGQGTTQVVYAEIPLPPDQKAVIPQNSAFADLKFALYLGRRTDAANLLETTGSLTGYHASATVPFGNTVLTLVGTTTVPLAGGVSADLPWVAALLGAVLAAMAALTAEYLIRRRQSAESLASANASLYVEQRAIAETLQHSLLPRAIPEVAGIDIGVRYVPGVGGIEVGGDWYDIIPTGAGQAIFAVGDVSGRGLGAATTMAYLRHAIRAYIAQGGGPGVVLSKLADLVGQSLDGYFATVLCGSIDVDRHRVTVASAGHFPPLVLERQGAHYVDMVVGPPIGVLPRPVQTETTITVTAGASVVAFTDGLVERRRESLDVGLARLQQAARRAQGDIDDVLGQLLVALAPGGSHDDIAILGVRWQA